VHSYKLQIGLAENDYFSITKSISKSAEYLYIEQKNNVIFLYLFYLRICF